MKQATYSKRNQSRINCQFLAMKMKASNKFSDRMSVTTGEDLFERWCGDNGHKWFRLGLTGPTIEGFRYLNPMLRNIPDYFVQTEHGCRVVQVKGTFNIKQSEYEMLDQMIATYSSKQCPFFYVFCIEGKHPLELLALDLPKIYEQSTPDRHWNDGKIYRNLNLWAKPL